MRSNVTVMVKGAIASIHGSFSAYAREHLKGKSSGSITLALNGAGLKDNGEPMKLRKALIREAIRCANLTRNGLSKEVKK